MGCCRDFRDSGRVRACRRGDSRYQDISARVRLRRRRFCIPANATGADWPFDVREAQRRDDWPKFSEAIESEIQNLKMARGSLLIGRYKAHWVLRGDHQTFDEPDLDDEDEEDESDDAANDDYKAEDTH